MNTSNWTGRTARDMEQAFGAHIRSSQAQIVPMDEPIHPADALVVKASVFCLVVLVCIFIAEWFAPEWFA